MFYDGKTGARVQSPDDFKAYDPALYAIRDKIYAGHHIPADVYYGKNLRPAQRSASQAHSRKASALGSRKKPQRGHFPGWRHFCTLCSADAGQASSKRSQRIAPRSIDWS